MERARCPRETFVAFFAGRIVLWEQQASLHDVSVQIAACPDMAESVLGSWSSCAHGSTWIQMQRICSNHSPCQVRLPLKACQTKDLGACVPLSFSKVAGQACTMACFCILALGIGGAIVCSLSMDCRCWFSEHHFHSHQQFQHPWQAFGVSYCDSRQSDLGYSGG